MFGKPLTSRVMTLYRTTPKISTGESPYSLVYRIEVVIPTEVISSTLRARDESQNSKAVTLSLNLLEEKREQTLIRMAYYHNQIVKYNNKKVQRMEFKPSDLVLRKVFQNTQKNGARKFRASWEGLYRVTAVVKRGLYNLEPLS